MSGGGAPLSRREQTRERILTGARELLAAGGVHGLSMRRLAEQSGCSPAALYKYFPSKEDIVAAMRERFFEHLARHMDEILERGGDMMDQFRGGCRAYVETGLSDPELYAAGFNISSDAQMGPAADLSEGASFRAQAFLRLRDKISELMEAGRFAAGNAHAAAFSVWSAMHGLTSLLICLPMFPGISRSEIIGRHIEVIVTGLKSDTARPLFPG